VFQWIKSSLRRFNLGDYLKSIAFVGIATLVSGIAFGFVPQASLTLIYLIAIVLGAQRYGLRQAIVASVLAIFAWDYFFTQPYHSLEISSCRDIFTLMFFMIVALLVSGMTAHIRQQNIRLGQLAEKMDASMLLLKGWERSTR